MLDPSMAIGRTLCVLHVDDHVVNRRLVQEILGGYGHEAVGAASGYDALDLLDHQLFDVVLMDINMPGINGIEVVRRLRGMQGPAGATPVIALTSEVSRTPMDYLALGFNGFVSKPFKVVDLLMALRDCAMPCSLEAGSARTKEMGSRARI